jgi:hypothetical protein
MDLAVRTGDKMTTETTVPNKCSICRGPLEGHGNNAEPINDGQCCDICNLHIVLPARIRKIMARGALAEEPDKS